MFTCMAASASTAAQLYYMILYFLVLGHTWGTHIYLHAFNTNAVFELLLIYADCVILVTVLMYDSIFYL